MKFRFDIQGIRAVAVLAVLFFHIGLLPNGYLGVDIFFVISGFLITGILYKDYKAGNYSIGKFYLKRFRRIIPLVLFVNLIALLLGNFLMLPDDFENLSQSVIATNFFSNNILQFITTGNYWDTVNDFKPLMHTWSLGVEEQYYIVFPLIILLISKTKTKLFTFLLLITVLSFIGFLLAKNDYFKFYTLPTRFFEIAAGGLVSIRCNKLKVHSMLGSISLFLLLVLIFFEIGLSNEIKIVLSIIFTSFLLLPNAKNSLSNRLLTIRPLVYIGTISFSLYMWHQLVLAFYRYAIRVDFNQNDFLIVILIVFLLSVLSYHLLEDYLRKEKNISNRNLLILCSVLFLITTFTSFYVYIKGGVTKDFKILNINEEDAVKGMNSSYNDSIYKLDKNFSNVKNKKVLVIGDSFARDWVNVLLESDLKGFIDVSYSSNPYDRNLSGRIDSADVIFFSYRLKFTKEDYNNFSEKYKSLKLKNYWIVGTKSFGINNGIVYNHIQDNNYCLQKVKPENTILKINNEQIKMWNERYINLFPYVFVKGDVKVFTPTCKLISQDARHLTKDGALFFANNIDLNKYLKINLKQ